MPASQSGWDFEIFFRNSLSAMPEKIAINGIRGTEYFGTAFTGKCTIKKYATTIRTGAIGFQPDPLAQKNTPIVS